MKLNGTVLSRIFLGKIPTWSDPEIAALNPGLTLPDEKIVIVTRADGSGTTFNFTNYLGKVSRQFFDTVGSDLYVRWPSSITARGNQGVAQLVAATPNAIGYVELAQAVRSKLAYALIENPAGKFIKPEPASFAGSGIERGMGQGARLRPDAHQCTGRRVLSDHGNRLRADEQESVAGARARDVQLLPLVAR